MNESEIRPKRLFDQYLQLAKKDTSKFLDYPNWNEVDCPVCSSIGQQIYVKESFTYCKCPQCLTIFVNPSPPSEAFQEFYTTGQSTEFWSTHFYKETEKARREKIWKPKAKIIMELLAFYRLFECTLIDIGGGYGVFCEEVRKISNLPVLVIEPSKSLAAVCSQRELPVLQGFLEDISKDDIPASRNVFTCFELFEHLHSPAYFIEHLWGVMKPGDYLILTTLSGTGFDIELLGEHSKSVHPPHHVTFFNPSSIAILLESKGFNVLQIQTPGKLDVDIAFNQHQQVRDKFWRAFLSNSTSQQRDELQKVLAANQLSSHMLVVCTKP